MDKLREEFEEWAKDEGFSLERGIAEGGVNCIYTDGDTYILWQAWQASRASIVVDLPQRQSICASGYGDGYFVPSDAGEGLEYDETVEALRSIGLSIKGE